MSNSTGNWFYAESNDGKERHYYNLEHVRQIQVSDESIRVIFAHDHFVTFTGDAVVAFRKVCHEKGFML